MRKWLNEPTFSQYLFIVGLIPFFAGFLILYLIDDVDSLWALIGRVFLYGGIVISLPGYIGIWRWRWLQFNNNQDH